MFWVFDSSVREAFKKGTTWHLLSFAGVCGVQAYVYIKELSHIMSNHVMLSIRLIYVFQYYVHK